MARGDITGEQIREARERAGLTQDDLAKRLHVSRKTVGNWENERHLPRPLPAPVRDFVRQMGVAVDIVWVGPGAPEPTLQGASDAQLLSEIANRLARAKAPAGQ